MRQRFEAYIRSKSRGSKVAKGRSEQQHNVEQDGENGCHVGGFDEGMRESGEELSSWMTESEEVSNNEPEAG